MKQILIFLLFCLTACSQKQMDVVSEKSEATIRSTEFSPEELAKKSITRYIKKEMYTDSSVYKSISWGALDSIENPVSFKYRITHTYTRPVKFLTKDNTSFDSIVQVDMSFQLDSDFTISSVVETKNYAAHYDSVGVSYQMFGGADLERIGIQNGYEMVFFENNKNRFLIVGGKTDINSTLLMSKDTWIQTNIHEINKELLKQTDTIEHCIDVTGNDCTYYIFKEGKLIEEKDNL